MGISNRVHEQMGRGSWIRQMFEAGIALRQRLGEERVFDLSLGNPVVEPPQEFRAELLRLAQHPVPGMHRYMPNAGYPETRAAVARQLAAETGLPYQASDVVMTCGAGGGLNVVLRAIMDPGDEVIVLAPYFVEYLFYVENHGGVPVVVDCDEAFNPDLAILERSITKRTRAVLLNSPNNPTGVVYSAKLLDSLAELLRRKAHQHGKAIYILSDEPYRKLVYDGLKYPFVQHRYTPTVVATSHSKDLALPGERIGYVAVNPELPDRGELVDAIVFCNRVLGFVNAPALMQHLVRSLQGVTVDVADYQRKRDFLYARLVGMGYQMTKPQGAFYMFPKSPMPDDRAFVERLLNHNVLVVPGVGFGKPGYFRISYCLDDRVLEGALDGFRAVARELGLTS
ncbi:MAG: pyridoxal phosphate-dependent aminotransferase [Chloroflexi bacterium]|nr:pyridoxal phosphate-dependent aminotransferase [Chloroflexota bacterium]